MLWLVAVATEAATSWSDHKDSRQGAALAYYSIFSLGPIIVIAIAVAGFFFGGEAVTGHVAGSIKDMLGETGAKAIQAMLADAGRPREGTIASLLGLGALLFAAIGVVVQLKDALNTVWEVEDAPRNGMWHFIRSYVVPLAAVMAVIAFYIGKQGLESTYGTAASIIVVLIWVYYTSQIVLMGAEVTHVFAKHHGSIKARGCGVRAPMMPLKRRHAGLALPTFRVGGTTGSP